MPCVPGAQHTLRMLVYSRKNDQKLQNDIAAMVISPRHVVHQCRGGRLLLRCWTLSMASIGHPTGWAYKHQRGSLLDCSEGDWSRVQEEGEGKEIATPVDISHAHFPYSITAGYCAPGQGMVSMTMALLSIAPSISSSLSPY